MCLIRTFAEDRSDAFLLGTGKKRFIIINKHSSTATTNWQCIKRRRNTVLLHNKNDTEKSNRINSVELIVFCSIQNCKLLCCLDCFPSTKKEKRTTKATISIFFRVFQKTFDTHLSRTGRVYTRSDICRLPHADSIVATFISEGNSQAATATTIHNNNTTC